MLCAKSTDIFSMKDNKILRLCANLILHVAQDETVQ